MEGLGPGRALVVVNNLVLRVGPFDSVKVMTATTHNDRAALSDRLSNFIGSHDVTEIVITQSSDSAFHCLAFTMFYRAAG
jgi:hypothetical protein